MSASIFTGVINGAQSEERSWFASLRSPTRRMITVIAILFSVLPLLVVAHYPLVDYPNHLARFQIYQSLPTSPALRQFWVWHWAVIPDLAFDVLMVPLTWMMPVEPAANFVTVSALVGLCCGTMLLDHHLNGARWGLSLFAGILLYSGAFRFGFVNYIITVAAALFCFAGWLRWRERVIGPGFLGFLGAGVALFIMHLYGFGLYAVAVGGYELALFWDLCWRKRWQALRHLGIPIAGAVSLILPLLLLFLSPTSENAEIVRWSTLHWKFEASISPIFFDMPRLELSLLGILVALIVLGFASRSLRLHPNMRIALLIMAALFFLLQRTVFGSNYADYRLLPGVSFFFLASLRLELQRSTLRHAVVLLLAALLVLRVGSILADWLAAQPILDEYQHALAMLPPGAKILVLEGSLGSASAERSPPLTHVPAFAAARQQDFVPYTFSDAPQPLHKRPPYTSYTQFGPYPEDAQEMGRYDYLLAVRNPRFTTPAGSTLKPIGSGESYRLFAIEHSPG